MGFDFIYVQSLLHPSSDNQSVLMVIVDIDSEWPMHGISYTCNIIRHDNSSLDTNLTSIRLQFFLLLNIKAGLQI